MNAINSAKILKYSAVAATMGAPAAYMIHFHTKMYTDPIDKKKMRNTQLGFWGGMSAGVLAVHRAFMKHRKNTPVVVASLAFMALSSFVGVKIAKAINKAVYPHKYNPLQNDKLNIPQPKPATIQSSQAFDTFLSQAVSGRT